MYEDMVSKLNRKGDDRTCPIIILVRGGHVLTGLRNYTKEKWKDVSVWTVPGGRCDPGETLEITLRREVFEETGIGEFEILAYMGEVDGAKEGDRVPLFFGRTQQEARLMEPEKFSEWRWIPINEYMGGAYGGFNPAARDTVVAFLQKNADIIG